MMLKLCLRLRYCRWSGYGKFLAPRQSSSVIRPALILKMAASRRLAVTSTPAASTCSGLEGDNGSSTTGNGAGDGSELSNGHAEGARRPFLIGVAGGTASGKSTVCQKIIEALEQSADKNLGRRVEVIGQECFYRTLDDAEKQLALKGQFDFDHPDAFDEKLMTDTLNAIMDSQPTSVSEYDFRNNCPNPDRVRIIRPADVILFEGILIFYFKNIREMFSMKLFVDTDADTRLARRVERDMKERNRNLEQILHQYITYVKPAFEEFCLPTKKYADVIIPRGADNTVAIDLIVQHIQDLLRHGVAPDVTHSASVHPADSTGSFRPIEDQKFSAAH